MWWFCYFVFDKRRREGCWCFIRCFFSCRSLSLYRRIRTVLPFRFLVLGIQCKCVRVHTESSDEHSVCVGCNIRGAQLSTDRPNNATPSFMIELKFFLLCLLLCEFGANTPYIFVGSRLFDFLRQHVFFCYRAVCFVCVCSYANAANKKCFVSDLVEILIFFDNFWIWWKNWMQFYQPFEL